MPPTTISRDPKTKGADGVQRFLACSHIFSSAVRDNLEDRLISEVSRHSLSRTQFRLLRLVAGNGEPQVGELASVLGVSPAAASKHLDALERLRLVRRESSPRDRRATLLAASAEGKRLVREYERLLEQRLGPVIDSLGRERAAELCSMLEQVYLQLLQSDSEQGGSCLRCGGFFLPSCAVEGLLGRCPNRRREERA